MKKNLLENGQNVEFVKAGELFEGVLIEKNVYNATVELANDDKDVLDVPYKDIKEIL